MTASTYIPVYVVCVKGESSAAHRLLETPSKAIQGISGWGEKGEEGGQRRRGKRKEERGWLGSVYRSRESEVEASPRKEASPSEQCWGRSPLPPIAPPPRRRASRPRTPPRRSRLLGTACTRTPGPASWTRLRTGGVSLCSLALTQKTQKNKAYEFELVHSLASVPVHKGFAAVHGRELVADTLEEGLDARWVS